ncbi:MAG: hypothetical protein M3Q54_04495, partial [Actinomycetota bacterium]|nr:hypothetical protein [Actinomycetota bacterium]
RPDLIVEICCASEDDESEPYTEIVMFESKIGSVEGEDQLKRYAAHLKALLLRINSPTSGRANSFQE